MLYCKQENGEICEDMSKHSKITYKLTLIAMSVAIITLCSWISVPFAISFTLQIFAIFLISACFPIDISFFSVCTYLLLGLLGVPVFSGFNAGVSAFLNASGGFLISFMVCVPIISLFRPLYCKRRYLYLLTMSVSLAFCYLLGCIWYIGLYKVAFPIAFSVCVLPFLPIDIIKIFIAFILFNKLYNYIKRLPI